MFNVRFFCVCLYFTKNIFRVFVVGSELSNNNGIIDCGQVCQEGSARWCGGMSQLPEDVEDDVEGGYISSDESAHGADLAERLRVKPSKDIWELGRYIFELIQCIVLNIWHGDLETKIVTTDLHFSEFEAYVKE